jgi:hypothetical protein
MRMATAGRRPLFGEQQRCKRMPTRKNKGRRKGPLAGDLLRIVRPIGEQKSGERRRFVQYDFDLGEREFAAIG